MKPDAARVCIILVNWNGWQDTLACVESCRTLSYPNFEMVVIDNGSTDDSVARIRKRFPDVRIITAGANLGFAGGNNLGITWALERGASYVWLLNNDTVVEETSLSALVEALERNPSAGIVGSKIYFFDRPATLWFAGGFVSPSRGWTYHRGEGERDNGQYDSEEDIDYATGASLLVRREAVEQIGPMSEDYFLYWEETDWCERARQAGWRVVYVPTSRIWHKVGASIADDRSHLRARYEGRNRVLFYQRNRPRETARVAGFALASALSLMLRGRPQSGLSLARGVFDAFSHRIGAIHS